MEFYLNNTENNLKLLKIFLRENNLETSINSNPDRFISRSITQTKLSKYISCPSCYFKKNKSDTESDSNIMLSNSIHLIADYLIRNQLRFPRSRDVLDFINNNYIDGYYFDLDYFQRKTKRYIEIIGEKGRLSWNYNKRLLEFYNFKKNKRVILAKSKCINNVYKDLTIDFLDSLKKRKNILLDYKQGLNTLKLCEKLKSKIVN